MSVARLYTVKKARKAQRNCSKCGTPINPGDSYRYWEPGFRSNYKVVRCSKSECTPRPSERESSKMATPMAALEDAQANLDGYRGSPEDDTSTLQGELDSVRDSLQETADEYREADEQFGGGGNTESGEKADMLEEAANELESASFEDWDEDWEKCDEHLDSEDDTHESCDECAESYLNKRNEWWDAQIEVASDALGEVAL